MTRYPQPARVTLADQVVDHLVDAIVRGDHPPGSRLPPEDKLSELAAVSRLTVREAIKVLRLKGVVRVEQGRGTFVNPPSRWAPLDPRLLAARTASLYDAGELARKLTEARGLVEVGVADLAAERRSTADLRALEDELAAMHASLEDVDAFSKADIAFHAALMTAADNPFVAALFEPLAVLLRQVRRETSRSRSAREQAIAWHTRILEAVRAGSRVEARAAMEAHMNDTSATLDRAIREGDLRLLPFAAEPLDGRQAVR
jgi:GntR family transcriptional regulator, transcriptional repressor for pyruvate dehydrogenase complex